MKLKRYILAVLVVIALIIPVSVSAGKKIQVFVSILPQKYFVERIGGDKVSVDALVLPGKSPATYSPKISQIRKLASSKLYFRIGVPFENGFMRTIESMDNLKVVDTRKGITLREMAAHHHDEDKDQDHDEDHHHDKKHHDEDHDHDHNHDKKHDDDHDHTGKDPHIWTNPMLVIKQSETVYKELAKIDPANRNYYRKNFEIFKKDLERLNGKLTKVLLPLKGTNFFVFHPSFGYFADQYGLKQIAVEKMGKAPKGRELFSLIQKAKKEKARVIFVQPQFDRHTAAKIARTINGAVVSINPLAYDYLKNMENIAETVAKSLKK